MGVGNSRYFTISQLVAELQIEAFKSDLNFQQLQNRGWSEFEESKEGISRLLKQNMLEDGSDKARGSFNPSLHKGFARQELLSVHQYKYEFKLMPYEESFFKSVWRKINFKPQIPENVYELYKPGQTKKPIINISILISRTPLKNYEGNVNITKEPDINPESIHVSDLIK